MSFSNEFLCDFKPVYEGILAAKGIKPERAVVEVIDEEQEGAGMFEPAGALEVLEQIGDDVNTLTIYTDRVAYFRKFAETMYEKNGLVSQRDLFFIKGTVPLKIKQENAAASHRFFCQSNALF